MAAAVSGGADSLALLLCLRELSGTKDFELVAVHLDHGIRGEESLEDAAFVEERCCRLGVPLYAERVDVPKLASLRRESLETAGRRAREELFERLRRDGLADVVATAHHQEDNAESVLMHVLRGCGVDGLAGMRPRRGMLIRPFLCLSKEEILAYLADRGETWREDSTNSDEAYARNFLRGSVLPMLAENVNPKVSASLNRLSECAARDAELLGRLAREASARLLSVRGSEVRLPARELLREEPALIPRIILEAARAAGREADVELAHIRGVERLAQTGRSGARLQLGGGLEARLEYGELVLSVETSGVPREETRAGRGRNALANGDVLRIDDVCERGQSAAYREYVDGDRLPKEVTVRTRRPGDVFHPLNAPGKRKLKEYFIDRKVPRRERDRTPLLAVGNRILWVVGSVISNDVRIDGDTKRVCRLTYEPARRNDESTLRGEGHRGDPPV